MAISLSVGILKAGCKVQTDFYLLAVYSQAQGCVWAAPQLGGDVEQPWLVCRYDVIHKTGSTQHITTPLQEDRATAMGNMHKNCEDRTCSPEDMIADRQTNTQTHTDTLITILCFPTGSGVIKSNQMRSNSTLLKKNRGPIYKISYDNLTIILR